MGQCDTIQLKIINTHEVSMRVSKTALAKANGRADQARRSLARMREKYTKNNPNIMTVGATALGGALPAYLPALSLPAEVATIPTEGLIGAGLLYIAHMRSGKPEKKIIEGLGNGMIAVTAYKLAQRMQGE
jgi:hypothetical protein